MRKRVFTYIKIALLCATCGVLGWQARISYTRLQPSRLIEIRENPSDFHFINPLLLVDSPKESPEYFPLEKHISDYIDKSKSDQNADRVSVYFRDLNSGRWMGINENELYDPSSTLKVAVMIGYLKKAEKDPNILEKNLAYTKTIDPGQHYKPANPLPSGAYTASNLIKAMIIDSDNQALQALYNNDRQAFVDVLRTLQIPPPSTPDALDFMSTKTYSSLFRTLYSATYLSSQLSDQTLQLLTFANFKNGLVDGVPSGTMVAHKFGEHTYAMLDGSVKSRQLHDCGIVYYAGHPYFLCVMTEGKEFGALEKIISNISKIVYTQVAADNKK